MTVVGPADRKVDARSLRRSPLGHRAVEFDSRGVDGLRGVRLAEEPFRTQVDLRVPPENPAVARVERALGLALPRPGQVAGDAERAALRVGADEWLLVAPDGHADEVVTAVRGALAGSPGSAVDVSASRTALRLSGRMSREVLEKVCSLDLHPRAFGPGRCACPVVGRVRAILWQVGAEPAYRLLVHCSFAGYLADLLLDAMTEFTGR